MDHTQKKLSRRGMIKISLLGLAAIPFVRSLVPSVAEAAGKKIKDNDPRAKAWNYQPAKSVDPKKNPKFATSKGQDCTNCQFYKANPEKGWGACILLANDLVRDEYWCNMWTQKAG